MAAAVGSAWPRVPPVAVRAGPVVVQGRGCEFGGGGSGWGASEVQGLPQELAGTDGGERRRFPELAPGGTDGGVGSNSGAGEPEAVQ